MPNFIDPLIAALAGVGMLTTMAAAMRAGRVALALAERVRLWWRWRAVMARDYRREVA